MIIYKHINTNFYDRISAVPWKSTYVSHSWKYSSEMCNRKYIYIGLILIYHLAGLCLLIFSRKREIFEQTNTTAPSNTRFINYI